MDRIALLLWNIRSPINLGMLLRVAETYTVDVAVLGSSDLIADAEKMRTVSDFACGALQRAGFTELADERALAEFVGARRMIATSIETDAIRLDRFAFAPGDVVMLGNEYDGLPDIAVSMAASRLHIPMADVWTPKPISHRPIEGQRPQHVARDGMASLSVAIAGGIICYRWHTR
jgi:tRNA G18 (ribose-2'-O)-methylase SpoU